MRITFAMDWEETICLRWMECVGVLRMEMETGHRPEKVFNARPRCFLCIAQVTGRYWRFMSKKPGTVLEKWSKQCGVQGPWNLAPKGLSSPISGHSPPFPCHCLTRMGLAVHHAHQANSHLAAFVHARMLCFLHPKALFYLSFKIQPFPGASLMSMLAQESHFSRHA